jgi:predicted RND superfamily exporter protein
VQERPLPVHVFSRRGRIEAAFETWGRVLLRFRWLTIAVITALTLGLTSWLPGLRIDNSEENFLHADDPARVLYDEFRDRFGSGDPAFLIVHPPEIFDLAFLEKLRAFHRDLEREVPYLERVTSLINARSTRGERDELIVEDLLERWPENQEDLRALRERVLGNPLYINILISENAKFTTVSLDPYIHSTLAPSRDELAGFEDVDAVDATAEPSLLTDLEQTELVHAMRRVKARYAGPDFEIHAIGGPIFLVAMAETLDRDVKIFLTLAVLMSAVLLFLLFRRLSGVVLPLAVVAFAVLATMGIMVWLDIPMSVTLQILPPFLLVVGVCAAVHILAIVYQRLAAGSDREEAIIFALGHSGLPVVMTSLTTAGGLMSFAAAELEPIAQLGVVAPIGVLLAMVYSLTLLPALIAISPIHARPRADRNALAAGLNRILLRVGDAASLHPWRVVAGTYLSLAVGLGGFVQARFSHDEIRWFPEDDPLRVASELIDREFKGASVLEVLIDTGRENGLYDPDVLERIERAMRYAEGLEVGGLPINKAVSIVDVVKETHRALNENRPEYYELPHDRRLIAQELLLFENSGSDDLEELTDTQFQTARLSVRTPWVDALLYPDFMDQVTAGFRQILGEGMEFQLTGGAALYTRVFKALITTMARSYAIALVVITPLLILLIGNLRRGFFGMIPNLIPVFLTIALMGWLDIPLDASTLLIGGIIIGVAVDDTIHFMHKFNRYYEEERDARAAVRQTLLTTGSALLFTSLVLSAGAFVFLFGHMLTGRYFGVLFGFANIVGFLADVILGPALMVLVTRWEKRSGTEKVVAG